MTTDYIAIMSPDGSDALAEERKRVRPGYQVAVDRPGLLVLTTAPTDIVAMMGGDGVAIGTMFDRSGREAVATIDRPASATAHDSGGASLLAQFWGGFVAIISDPDGGVSIIRDPSGEVPCYWSEYGGVTVATSQPRDWIDNYRRVDFDWTTVVGHLLWPERRNRQTCLAGLCELMPGERLVVRPSETRVDPIWQPWRFTVPELRIDEREDAIELVRRATLNTVAGWCRRYPRSLVSLSGGLDSSIVLAAAQAHTIAAVTIMTDEPIGDERQYARAAADYCAVPLIERSLHIDTIDPRRSNAARLPRPTARLFGQAIDHIWRNASVDCGADALFHGGGGDNVFCYLTSCTPYLDSLLVRGPGRSSRATLGDVARLTKVSNGRVKRAALRKMLIEHGRYRWHRDAGFLTSDALALADPWSDHPWFDAVPPRTLPGKRAHVAALIRIQNYLEAIEPERRVPVVAPLMSQQVMEVCLRVPTWIWCEGGVNRAVARAAFRDHLPGMVIDRTSKGGPDAFEIQVMTAHHDTIREMLLEGQLAAHGLIDRKAVTSALEHEGPLRATHYPRLSALVDVEAWLQSWSAIRANGVAAQAWSRSARQR
ncbi:asparagine synthase-related protein [Sphingomonas sp. SUN019]|uniref:asparagine synthase-related protein n=1 Tax=Sphingomonas sp. SUN019 TaxID=2937788 RepID=UPI002164B1AD|nr:asparagine synthase-related protein [Sphingomonas sp. SUN019]UVO50148.1 asparagine synthase-related protein [Sphingomonas sp. SUN019]